jgi:phenylacetic acid degradation operon negative regulatory protein
MKPQARHLILDLLLASAGEPLSAREAVVGCALFDISANNARVALARLVSDGLIEPAGRASYALSAQAHELADDVATWRTAEQRVRAWSGDYIAVHCGALPRSDRKAMRNRERALGMLGFREWERGLYLRPDNIERDLDAVRRRLYLLGLERDASVFLARGLDPAREARVRRLWDGRALTATYRRLRRQIDAWLENCHALDPDTGAREAFLLGGKAIRHVVFDPLLPDPLVDAQARHDFVESVRRIDRVGRSIWKRMVDASGQREMVA